MMSSVVGFDFGYKSCYIAVARGGGIDIVDNEYSSRTNPTAVAYGNGSDGRKMGTNAQNQISSNLKNTVVGFKPLVGRTFDDPEAQPHLLAMFNDSVKSEDNSVGFKIDYDNDQIIQNVECITATYFGYLKGVAEAKLGFVVIDCVISVPAYFTDYQRRAMIFAAQTAGLNVLRLMNDTTAVALAYGIYKQDLPVEKEKSRLVVFVDVGHNDTQISAVAFNKGKLEVKKTLSDPNLGGRHFDEKIFNVFKAEFMKKYKLNVDERAKAVIRLKTECEKMKKTMSANSTPIPLNIECFMNDIDVSGKMDRETFEDISADLFTRLRNMLQELLHNASFSVEDIDAVEVVGGMSRMPAVKNIVTDVLKKQCSTTLNADEAVARGCALQCAILSPAFKVRDFVINDVMSYGMKLIWYDPNGTLGGDMEVFTPGHAFPFSKMLTFYRKENLILEASYSTAVPHPYNIIGKFEVGPITPTDGESTKVKVKVKVDLHGQLTVESAHTVTKIMVEEEVKEKPKEEAAEKIETAGEEEEAKGETPEVNGDTNKEPEEKEAAEKIGDEPVKDGSPEKKTKKKVKTVQNQLNINSEKPGLSAKLLQNNIEFENKMKSQDKLIRDRQMAKNAVEEYVYEMRDKCYSNYEKYITGDDRDVFLSELSKTEDWLYDEGENCNKQVYVDKLGSLKTVGDSIVRRYTEHEMRPGTLNALGASLVHVRKILTLISAKEEQYIHLTEEDIKTVTTAEKETTNWFNEASNKTSQQVLHVDPAVTVAEINNKRKAFEDLCNPIINKPKPKVEPPVIPAETTPAATEETTDVPMEEAKETTDVPAPDPEMEVD